MGCTVAFVVRVLGVLTAAGVVLTACGKSDPRTPEERAARGDERLRAMSDTLSKAQSFSFETTETHDRVRRNGERREETIERQIVVRRPDRLWAHVKTKDGEHTTWYDGKTLSLVAPTHKVFVRREMPPTIDAMVDRVMSRFDIQLPVADVIHSSPYDSFALQDAKGGWTRREDVEGRPCEVLAYEHKAVSFTVWVTSGDPALPCRLDITYSAEQGAPKSRLIFRNWNLAASIPADQFTAVIPAGYEEIPVVERIPVDQVKETLGPAAAAPPAKKK